MMVVARTGARRQRLSLAGAKTTGERLTSVAQARERRAPGWGFLCHERSAKAMKERERASTCPLPANSQTTSGCHAYIRRSCRGLPSKASNWATAQNVTSSNKTIVAFIHVTLSLILVGRKKTT